MQDRDLQPGIVLIRLEVRNVSQGASLPLRRYLIEGRQRQLVIWKGGAVL